MAKRSLLQRCPASAVLALAGLIFLGASVSRTQATNRTWNVTSGLWTTPGNWLGSVAPVAGDNLIFNTGSLGIAATNNYPSGTTFGQIDIGANRFATCTLTGSPIVLTNGISMAGPNFSLEGVVDCNITLSRSQTFFATRVLDIAGNLNLGNNVLFVSNSSTVIFGGTVTGTSSVEVDKTGTGILQIFAGASLQVPLEVDQGTLQLDGTATSSAPISVIGSTVSGTGMADTLIPSFSTQSLLSGIVSPGDNGPGILQCNWVTLSGEGDGFVYPGELQVAINGTVPGTNYGQLVVYSNYFLSVPTYSGGGYAAGLDVQLGYTPQIGDSFLILKQVSAAGYDESANGTFFGQPSNSICDTTNGYSFVVSYDNNGVTLTTFRTPDSAFTLWKGSGVQSANGFFLNYGDRRWSKTNNWAGGAVPGSDSHVEFTPHQAYYNDDPGPPITNDLASGTSIASLLFTDTNYALYGNALTVTGGITNSAGAGTNSVLLSLIAVGALPLDVSAGGSLLLGGSFNGSGTLQKESPGKLRYTGTTMNSFVGSVVVDSGTFQADGSLTDGSFTVNGGLLDGTGVISSVTMTGGTLKPGDSPGVLVIQGNLSMTSGTVFEAELNGPLPGSSYDQLQVNGTVNLNGATLNLQPGFTATPGTAFLILVNDLSDPIVGTFAGLPEGAVFQAGGQFFSISYKAGTGANDVVVTTVGAQVKFSSITQIKTGTVQLNGAGADNVSYTIQANTNLSTTNWVTVGTAPANGSGVFVFSDTNALLFPRRFFRALGP
jgi:hypothetical protein